MESNEKLTMQVLHNRLKIFKNSIIFIYFLLCLFFLYTFLDDFEIPICLNWERFLSLTTFIIDIL